MSQLFFGQDNPYRAPRVAKDVATFQGAEQEFVVNPVQKSDAMDFFYQGVQSFQKAFDATKQYHEKQAFDLMADLENQKAQDILNGRTADEVNHAHRQRYAELSDSGAINKNLDAYKTMTSNYVEASGKVTADIAQDHLEAYNQELAEKGYSYVERQEITKKYRNRVDGTQIGDLLAPTFDKVDNAAKSQEREYLVNKEIAEIGQSAAMAIFDPAVDTPEGRSEIWHEMSKGTTPGTNVPFYTPGTTDINGAGLTHLTNRFYETHFAPQIAQLPEEQRAFAEMRAKDQAAVLAKTFAEKKRADDVNIRMQQENAGTLANMEQVLNSDDSDIWALAYSNPELAVHVDGPEDVRAASYSANLQTLNRGTQGDLLAFGWGTGENSVFRAMLAKADTFEEQVNLMKSFPPEDFTKAQELKYTLPDETPEKWASRRREAWKAISPTLAQTGSAMIYRGHQQALHGAEQAFLLPDGSQERQAALSGYAQATERLTTDLKSLAETIGVNMGEEPGVFDREMQNLYKGVSIPGVDTLIDTVYKMDKDYLSKVNSSSKKGGANTYAEIKRQRDQWALTNPNLPNPWDGQLMQAATAEGKELEAVPNLNYSLSNRTDAIAYGTVEELGQTTLQLLGQVQSGSNAFRHLREATNSGAVVAGLKSDNVFIQEATRGAISGGWAADILEHDAFKGAKKGALKADDVFEGFRTRVADGTGTAYEWVRQEGNAEWSHQFVERIARRDGSGNIDWRSTNGRLVKVFGQEGAERVRKGYYTAEEHGFAALNDGEQPGYYIQDGTNEENRVQMPLYDVLAEGRENLADRMDRVILNETTLSQEFDLKNPFVEEVVDYLGTIGSTTTSETKSGLAFEAGWSAATADTNMWITDSIMEKKMKGQGMHDGDMPLFLERLGDAVNSPKNAHVRAGVEMAITEWMADNPFVQEAGTTDEAAAARADYAKRAIGAGLSYLSENYRYTEGQLIELGVNPAADRTHAAMMGNEATWTNNIDDNSVTVSQRRGQVVAQGSLTEMGEANGYDTEAAKGDLYMEVFMTETPPKDRGFFGDYTHVGDFDFGIAYFGKASAGWRPKGSESSYFEMAFTTVNPETGRRTFDRNTYLRAKQWASERGKRFNAAGIAGSGDSMEMTMQNAAYITMYALADKTQRLGDTVRDFIDTGDPLTPEQRQRVAADFSTLLNLDAKQEAVTELAELLGFDPETGTVALEGVDRIRVEELLPEIAPSQLLSALGGVVDYGNSPEEFAALLPFNDNPQIKHDGNPYSGYRLDFGNGDFGFPIIIPTQGPLYSGSLGSGAARPFFFHADWTTTLQQQEALQEKQFKNEQKEQQRRAEAGMGFSTGGFSTWVPGKSGPAS